MIKDLQICYMDIAKTLIKKYDLSKTKLLEEMLKDKFYFTGCPFEIEITQVDKLLSLGADLENYGQNIMIYIILILFPELKKDFELIKFNFHYKLFWQSNYTYYKQKGKTIFEDYDLPQFEWEAYNNCPQKDLEFLQTQLKEYDLKVKKIIETATTLLG